MTDLCRHAEDEGAGALWAVDHLFWPHPVLECLTVLTAAATATRTVSLGTCVLQLPLRTPAAVAKQTATLQVLSGGRFTLGVGVGSHRGEYEAAGARFTDRGRRLTEGILALRRCWSGPDRDPAPGSVGTEPGAGVGYPQAPRPGPGPVPVWVGGSSAAARRRAAGVGDGWVPLFVTAEEFAAGLAQVREECEAAGRDPAEVTPAVTVFARVGRRRDEHERGIRWLSSLYGIPPRAFDRHLVSGTGPACAEAVEGYRRAGAAHVVVMVADDHPFDQYAELLGTLPASWRGGGVPAGPRPEQVEVPA